MTFHYKEVKNIKRGEFARLAEEDLKVAPFRIGLMRIKPTPVEWPGPYRISSLVFL